VRQIYVNRKRHEKGAENKDRSAFLVTADGSVVAHNNKDYLPKESGNTTITKVLPELNLKGFKNGNGRTEDHADYG